MFQLNNINFWWIFFLCFAAQVSIVFCENSAKAEKLMREKTFIKYIIIMDNFVKYSADKRAQEIGVKLLAFEIASEVGSVNYRKPDVSN